MEIGEQFYDVRLMLTYTKTKTGVVVTEGKAENTNNMTDKEFVKWRAVKNKSYKRPAHCKNCGAAHEDICSYCGTIYNQN